MEFVLKWVYIHAGEGKKHVSTFVKVVKQGPLIFVQ